jgi:hypothetical protein
LAVRRPAATTQLAAWLVTGPVGHLAGGILDWLVLIGHYVRARARGRDPWS